MSIHSQAESFAKVADSYVRGRPEYPVEMIEWMQRVTGIESGDHVVDLGAGTGKFTQALVNLGLRVTAVEPVDEMREQLSALLPDVLALSSVAQHVEIESDSADLVTCAQSFHWFASDDAIQEISRILRPEHYLILVWNQRDTSNPIQQKFSEIFERYQDAATPSSPSRRWQPVIDGSSLFELVDEARFTLVHELSREVVPDRLRSMSVFSTLSDELQAAAIAEVNAIIPEEKTISLPYYNEAYAYRLAP